MIESERKYPLVVNFKPMYSCTLFVFSKRSTFSFVSSRNLAKSQQRLVKLGNALDKVDREVAEMRKR